MGWPDVSFWRLLLPLSKDLGFGEGGEEGGFLRLRVGGDGGRSATIEDPWEGAEGSRWELKNVGSVRRTVVCGEGAEGGR